MRRIVQLLMLFLVLGQALGLDWVAAEDACQESCDDDTDGRHCPPSCPSCTCSLRSAPAVPPTAPVIVALPTTSTVSVPETERIPGTPEPREIMHVPIALLA